jgi:hypothetical protein
MAKRTNQHQAWVQIHKTLERDVVRSGEAFMRLRQACPGLSRFPTAAAVLLELRAPNPDDRVYHHLLAGLGDRDARYSALARDLLWLGFWPMLDAFHEQHCRRLGCDQEAAEISLAFSEALYEIIPSDVPASVAITKATERQLMRQRRENGRWLDRHQVGLASVETDADGVAVAPRRRDEAVRAELSAAVGWAGELLFDHVVLGYSAGELGRQERVSKRTIERTLQSARKRLRVLDGE